MVSVCIATYNGENYIREQLESILVQLGSQDEVIISDDGSQDLTLDILYSFKDDRIRIFENSFQNVVSNFEFLIRQSKGDLIFLCDQDDVWNRNKLQITKGYFNVYPSNILVISNLVLIDKFGNDLGLKFFNYGFNSSLAVNLIKNNFIGCGMAFKSSLKPFILPIPKTIPMHDWWIGCIALIFGNVSFLNQSLVFYRRHDSNVTSGKSSNYYKRLSWRVILVKELIKRYFKMKFS
jgi:glycosyltransferase involved in cell wall biosynthesis